MSTAYGHGEVTPKYGGVTSSGETTFEMVQRPRELAFYVEDHGVPISMAGATGTVSIERAGITLVQDVLGKAPNLAVTKGVALATGDRLTVRMVLRNGDVHIGRFRF